MSTIKVVNIQHPDSVDPNLVLQADGDTVFASGLTVSGTFDIVNDLTVSGNTGLGTSSPTSKLHVVDTTTNLQLESTADSSSGKIDFIGKDASSNSYTTLTIDTNSTGEVNIETDPDNGGYSTDKSIIFKQAGSEKVRIDDSGNFGIGISNPISKLHIRSSQTVAETVAMFGNASINNGLQIQTTDGNLVWGFNAVNSRSLVFSTNQTERARIDATGNVGIGTSSPGRALHVSNSTSIVARFESTGTSFGGIELKDANTTADFKVQLAAIGDALKIDAGGNERIRIASGGNVGIGTNNPAETVHIQKNTGAEILLGTGGSITDSLQGLSFYGRFVNGSTPALPGQLTSYIREERQGSNAAFELTFGTSTTSDATERMRIDSDGNVGIGTTSPGGRLEVETAANERIIFDSAGTNQNPRIQLVRDSGNDFNIVNELGIFKIYKNTDNIYRYSSDTHVFSSAGTERARLTSTGTFLVAKTATSASDVGCELRADGFGLFTRSAGSPLLVNRETDDGTLVSLRQNNVTEGSISVSGGTVSYNGGHLSRWSQLAGNAARIEILRGSVLSNLDEMCEWGEEDNEQLNRMKVSDVEGDVNVAGVFQAWDDDDEIYTNDFYCAMTGDFVIRIAQGTTVTRGDLLMSAGDGTAKPQGDDIIRSKTIAKVTSTVVSETYADGSYCVPCVLMAC